MGVDEDNIDIYRSMEDMVSPAGPTDQVGPHCQKKNVCRYDVEIDTHLKWFILFIRCQRGHLTLRLQNSNHYL